MANFLVHAQLANNVQFHARVQAATIQTALNISGEAGTGEATQLRQAYAQRHLLLEAPIAPVVWAVAANVTIQQGFINGNGEESVIPDGDLEFVLATVWDDLSGAARVPAEA
jgi:hypothetical protein